MHDIPEIVADGNERDIFLSTPPWNTEDESAIFNWYVWEATEDRRELLREEVFKVPPWASGNNRAEGCSGLGVLPDCILV